MITEHKQKFKHKYNIGDIVYYTNEHKVEKKTIEDVMFFTQGSVLSTLESLKDEMSINYTVEYKMAVDGDVITEKFCSDRLEDLCNIYVENPLEKDNYYF